MKHTDLRDNIIACRACNDSNILPSPRYGTGAVSKPARIMIVGQNPPREESRCKQGAWMIHYRELVDQIGPHEQLVWDLVDQFPWELRETYATQGVKCPTSGNSQPSRWQAQLKCSSWLREEIRLVRPPIILAFGDGGHDAVMMALSSNPSQPTGGPFRTRYVQPVGASVDGVVRVWSHLQPSPDARFIKIIHAPHPSKVGRFINRESWMTTILGELLP